MPVERFATAASASIQRTVFSGIARWVLDMTRELGVDIGALLDEAGVAPASLVGRDARIGATPFLALVRAAQDRTAAHVDAPLRMAKLFKLSYYGIVGYVTSNAATVHEGFSKMQRYEDLVYERAAPRVAFEEDRFILASKNAPWMDTLYLTSEAIVIAGVDAVRQFVASPVMPLEVHVQHRRRARGLPLEDVFGCPVRYGADAMTVVFDEHVGRMRIRAHEPELASHIEEQAATLLGSLPMADGDASLSSQVKHLLGDQLRSDEASSARLARRLGMSERTFQRRLADEGVSFSDLLDRARHESALSVLREAPSVKEAGYILGYRSSTAFIRAFRRWTGVAPTDYRRACASRERAALKVPALRG